MKKPIIILAVFLLVVAGAGYGLFRAIVSADKYKNESAAISTILTIADVQKDSLKPEVSNCAS